MSEHLGQGRLFANHYRKIIHSEQDEISKFRDLYRLLTLIFETQSDLSGLEFTTLFSRIVFVSVQRKIPGDLLRDIHAFRKAVEDGLPTSQLTPAFVRLAGSVLARTINYLYGHLVEFDPIGPIGEDGPKKSTEEIATFERVMEGIIMDRDDEGSTVTFVEQNRPHLPRVAHFSEKYNNLHCFRHIVKMNDYFPNPLPVNFIDCTINEAGGVIPSGIVLLPDFLVDVTSVSECFRAFGQSTLSYLIKKFIPVDISDSLLIGNIANYFLDELVYNPGVTFASLMPDLFQMFSDAFALMTDEELRDLMTVIRLHFNNLRNVVGEQLEDINIQKEGTYLEPSFYSNQYGLQGRLDLYHINAGDKCSDIVELKSGKTFKPNTYGLNPNHYVQTLLYDLIIESVSKGRLKTNSYILYSRESSNPLRFAPRIRAQQLHALDQRNRIVILEKMLMHSDKGPNDVLSQLFNPSLVPESLRFVRRDIEKLSQAYKALGLLERLYLLNFTGFCSREFHLAKTGKNGIFTTNGLASLWLDPLEEKQDNFSILSFLTITGNQSGEKIPVIEFSMSERSNRLSRFRKGDIGVLYPYSEGQKSVLRHQIFKCSIVEIGEGRVVVRLRARQKNQEMFISYTYWNIEPDVLDSGFNHQFQSLYKFIRSEPSVRRKILSLEPPQKPVREIPFRKEGLTDQQNRILGDIISAEDYYLLWGPPGTGKTSVVIGNLVHYYLFATSLNILCLSYTNRAVDEMCHAVLALDDKVERDIVRLGSRYAVDTEIAPLLLSTKMEEVKTREDLVSLYDDHRVFISTVATFQGHKTLSRLKDFDIVIVDEASQILEPMIVSVLSQFKKFILIGDHKQLPAVVAQDPATTRVNQPDLVKGIGLVDMRDSYFERLYRRCQQEGWTWAYGALTYQGRMHNDILEFVSPAFYDGQLNILPGIDRLVAGKLFDRIPEALSFLNERFLFIDIPPDDSLTSKTNADEAAIAVRIAGRIRDLYKDQGRAFGSSTVGIITPFRAQIATIKSLIEADGELKEHITIDTVERFQGGARDHIIISFATSQVSLLSSNVSTDGIDRKLNVALTRAREQLILLGSYTILCQNEVYASVIDHAREVKLEDCDIA